MIFYQMFWYNIPNIGIVSSYVDLNNSFVRAAYKILTIHKQYTVNTFLISGYCVDMVSLAHISKMVPIQLKDYFSMIYLAPSISY